MPENYGGGKQMDDLYDIGLIGLAVMGQNLVLNMQRHGFRVAVYNRTASKTQKFLAEKGIRGNIGSAATVAQFVQLLKRPRKIMLMVKAGDAVDMMIAELLPYLSEQDILIDGGNSFFLDTRRRCGELAAKNIRFIGMGVSGGEAGALYGPSLMPGGDLSAYKEVKTICECIAAKVEDGICCNYIGEDGAGHYVKMVHNGIEYGDMQLISEAYYIMKMVLGLNPAEMHAAFAEWNNGDLDSYLMEITRDILLKVDEATGQPLLELVLDKAGQKGTGKWTAQNALDLGVPVPTITEAVFARCMSAYKEQRLAASTILAAPQGFYEGSAAALVSAVHDALYASKICSYAQGFALMQAAGAAYGWNLHYGDIALLWRGGCIIRAKFLGQIKAAFLARPDLPNLMLDPFFREALARMQENWRMVVGLGKKLGIPLPAFSASLDYYDSYRQAILSANMLQAQRDCFGAHTYERIDKPGVFHTDWLTVK